MKRMHVHVAVEEIGPSVRFYSALFAAEPTMLKTDYAKWMLDDPRVNFAISARGHAAGVEHLGIQVEDEDELAEVYGRIRQADAPTLEEGNTVCCYAESEKTWVTDPAGIAWEAFLTTGESTVYGGERAKADTAACCTPKVEAPCCGPDAPKMDFILTVCDQAAGEVCPIWPGQPVTGHWGVPDPAAVDGSELEKRQAFREAFNALQNRIRPFVSLRPASLDHLSLKRRVEDIGRQGDGPRERAS